MIDEVGIGLVIDAAWKSALVAGSALLLLRLLKRRSAAERACVAHFGMAAVLLVPVLVLAGPKLEVPFLGDARPAGAEADAEASLLGLVLYLVPVAALLLMTMIAILRLFSLRARANVIVQQGWLTALAHAQRRMGIKHGTALLVTEELTSPVSWGVLRPVILLNEEALEASGDAEAIIAHELAHVARFDWLNLLAARVATALFWFNPLVWLLARQGHQLREEAADDAVLCADVPNTDYAALLVGAARHEGRGMLLAANGVASGEGSLAQRVRRILEPTLRRGPARFGWGASCAAGALLVAAPLAALAPCTTDGREARVDLAAAPASAPLARPWPEAPSAAPAPAPVPAPAPRVAPAARGTGAAAPSPAAPAAAPAGSPVPAPPAPAPAAGSAPAAAPIAVASAGAHGFTTVVVGPDARVHLRAHSVDAATLAAYKEYPGLRDASERDLASLRAHRVGANRLRDYAALGYRNLGEDQLVEWAVHGVSPGFIRGLAAVGYAGLSPGQLTRFRIMGVTASFIREVRKAGHGQLSPDRLVELRIHGIKERTVSRISSPPTPPPRPAPYG